MSYEDTKNKLSKSNQSQLLRFWDDLKNEEKRNFLNQLNTIDFEEVNDVFKDAMTASSDGLQKLDERMKPIPKEQFECEDNASEEQLEKYRNIGLTEISKGRVGVLLLAGGQGTRLGVTYPKGMYSVGLPSEKTLFQIQAERIKKIQSIAEEKTGKKGTIIWYIMTSRATFKVTQNFLSSNNYFGLQEENVVLFNQGSFPCFDTNGRILLDEKNNVALSPNGNGGIYRALRDEGVLSHMSKRGICYVHAHSVDNVLVKVADPVFLGYCLEKRADCGAKVVQKSNPLEAVGVICKVDNHVRVVEYSEITEQTANSKDTNGNLLFNSANICNHFFTTNFLAKVCTKSLKLHVAKKKIPFINDCGIKEKPSQINGVKIEMFIFDAFPYSDHFVTWEVARDSEFSPLKNSDDAGQDCPSTSRKDLFRLHKRYVEKSGGQVEGDVVEISPLVSYEGEGLTQIVRGKIFKAPTLLSD